MNRDELITTDSDEAIRVINEDSLLTTLVRIADAGHRSLFTATSKEGSFLGVFASENYEDRIVAVSNYQGSLESFRDTGFWVYDKTRNLVAFHARRLKGQISDRPNFSWDLSEDVIKYLTKEEYQKQISQPKDEFELRAFQPGDWQRHVQFIEKNLGYKLVSEE